jgi:hypothetical protein
LNHVFGLGDQVGKEKAICGPAYAILGVGVNADRIIGLLLVIL